MSDSCLGVWALGAESERVWPSAEQDGERGGLWRKGVQVCSLRLQVGREMWSGIQGSS